MILQFSIPGEPCGQGRPKFTTIGGHVHAYDPEKSRNYKAYAKLLALQGGDKVILQFSIPGEPCGQGRPKFTTIGGHVHAYDPEKSRNYKAYVKLLALQAVNKISWKCSDKPIRITLIASQSIPKSATKKFRAAALEGKEYPTKKPDIDNIYKGVTDALSGIAYKDDKQIISAEIYKNYAEDAKVSVWIYEVGNE